jgi:hypothetical protein
MRWFSLWACFFISITCNATIAHDPIVWNVWVAKLSTFRFYPSSYRNAGHWMLDAGCWLETHLKENTMVEVVEHSILKEGSSLNKVPWSELDVPVPALFNLSFAAQIDTQNAKDFRRCLYDGGKPALVSKSAAVHSKHLAHIHNAYEDVNIALCLAGGGVGRGRGRERERGSGLEKEEGQVDREFDPILPLDYYMQDRSDTSQGRPHY